MPRTFEEMFRDYDKELADVENQRVTENRKAEEKHDTERNGLLQEMQAQPDNAEVQRVNQGKIEDSYALEARDIERNDKTAQEKKGAIEADRELNQQERIAASGLKYDAGPIPEPPPLPPPPSAPPESKELEAQPGAQEQASGEGALRSMRDSFAAQATNWTAVATGIVMNVAETFHQPDVDHSQHQRPGIEGSAVAGMPSEHHAAAHPPHLEPIETIETDQQRSQATTTRVETPPEPRVQTTVYGVDEMIRPPPPPPPPANDNPSEGKSK